MTTTGLSQSRIPKEVQRVEPPLVLPLCVPHYSSVFAEQHSSYHILGHCLRANIFPGAPVVWSSLVKDSYVNHLLLSPPTRPQCWHGRRADDMVRWTERNIINQKLHKALKEIEQGGVAK